MGKQDDLWWTGDVVKVLHDDMHVWVRITKMMGTKFQGRLLLCKQPFVIQFEKWQIKDWFNEKENNDFLDWFNSDKEYIQ